MVDRDVENSMVLYAERPQTILACPHCGAEWEKFIDRDPVGIGTIYYEHDFDLTRSYPIQKDFCRACALESATSTTFKRFVAEKSLTAEFLIWSLPDQVAKLRTATDFANFWSLLEYQCPDFVDTRLREFIEEKYEKDFIDWRCEE